MNDKIRERIAKIQELVQRGDGGEADAAKQALDRIIAKYQLEGIPIDELIRKPCVFKYSTYMELVLLQQICKVLIDDKDYKRNAARATQGVREVRLYLRYIDYVTASCAYEYFRTHMKGEWKRLCMPQISRCRTPKTKAKKRKYLQGLFISKYLIKSKLYLPEEITTATITNQEEIAHRLAMSDLEGGEYKRQMNTGNLLEAAKR